MKLFRIILAIAILFAASLETFAQGEFDPVKFKESLKTASFKEKFEAANLLMEDQLYVYAADVLKALSIEQPDNANVNYKTGFCLLQISNERANALPYLIKAEKSISNKYDPFSYTETKAPFEAHYYLGRAHHLNENLDKAKNNFTLFIEDVSKKHKLYDKAILYLKQLEVAKVELPNPKEYVISNVGGIINSESEDFSPVVTLDEGAMYFTSRRVRPDSVNSKIFSPQDGMHFEDIYVSYYDFAGKKWGTPEVISSISSPKSNQATISVSGDGQQLFMYKDINGNGEIYVANYELESDDFGTPEKMGSDINTVYWETHATISADGKTLYFVSDRPGGLGGRDVYQCKKLPNGLWSLAQNLGAPINSANDEDSPYFHPDGKTLFFSSNGENSIGGFDIYFTKAQEDGSWGEPVNMGYPLNTVDDDVFFTTNAKGDMGYYSSAKKGGFGQKDIYTIGFDTSIIDQFAILKGYIDPGAGKVLPDGIIIYVTDLTEGGDPLEYKPNKRNGSYIFNLKPCNEYLVEYTRNDETFYETEFEVPCDANYNETSIVLNMDGVRLDGSEAPADVVELPKGDTSKWKYRLLVGDKPYLKTGFIEFMDGEVLAFDQLIDQNGYFKYKTLASNNDPNFVIDIKDPSLCDKLTIKLYDENGTVIKEITRDVRCKSETVTYEPVIYQKYYGYNLKGVDSDEVMWEKYVTGVINLIEKRGYAKVDIEGSASYVPTRTWKSNDILCKKRAEDGKAVLMKELKKRNIDTSKVKIVVVNTIVQGPKYNKDFKNTDKYGKFQYLKMKAY
jgi:hypothetical protein